MTMKEAQAEAVRRWGESGWAETTIEAQQGSMIKPHIKVFKVGAWRQVLGRGDSWESAFADADARRKEKKS